MSGDREYRLSRPRAEAYGPLVVPHLPRLLGHLDRQPHSASYGSFDRDHWAWKFRDFPVTVLQAGVCPLAYAWRLPLPDSPFHGNPRLLRWIEGAVEETCRRQRGDGSFDSVAPNTADHGVSLALAFFLWETARVVGEALSPSVRERTAEAVRRACAFGLESVEDHAFITNHQALFALGFRAGYDVTGEEVFRERADAVVEAILERQHPDGWYEEYGGFDPGYQSLALGYLARYWHDTGSSAVLESLRRAVAHFAHAVHPDGSVGGVYGSRHTALYAPAGLERLGGAVPMAAGVARFMRRRLARGNVVTPGSADIHNLPVLAFAYLSACVAWETEDVENVPQVPCQTSPGVRCYESGLVAAGRDRYYAVAALDRGGLLRAFDRRREALCYEDAGYLVRSASRLWSSQAPSDAAFEPADEEAVHRAHATLSEVRQILPTPVRFLLLRILNLTLFRSRALGRWIRRWIVRRLITERVPAPVRLHREIRFDEDAIRIRDELELTGAVRVDEVALTRSFTAFHMGSAKYFQRSELAPVTRPAVEGLADELNRSGRAGVSFEIPFPESGADIASSRRPREPASPGSASPDENRP